MKNLAAGSISLELQETNNYKKYTKQPLIALM